MNYTEKIQEVLRDPFKFIKEWKSQQRKKIIGIFPHEVIVEELIHASDMLPFNIINAGENPIHSGILPNFACPLITNIFDSAYHKKLEFLDGMIIPYVCDSSRALFHIWKKNFPNQFLELIRLPKKVGNQDTNKYLLGELSRFKESLEKAFKIKISNEALWKSIRIYNKNRSFLRSIQILRSKDPNFMNNYTFFGLVNSSMMMLKEEHNNILEKVNSQIKSISFIFNHCMSVKVFVSGNFVGPLKLYQWMDDSGILVINDDLINGSRYFSYDIEEENNALNALAKSYFKRIPNILIEGTKGRFNFIMNKVRENELEGVIFVNLKFCDSLAFDYPDLKKRLDQEGIPNLFIEIDPYSFNKSQIKTRLQAFVERLR